MKGAIDSILGLMHMDKENDYDYEANLNEVEEEDGEEEIEVEEKEKKSIFHKLGLGKEEEEEDDEEEETPNLKGVPKSQHTRSSKVVSMNRQNVEISVVRPQDLSEWRYIADYLIDGKTVVFNLEEVQKVDAQRIMDYVAGACHAVDGTLQAISNTIFIVAPEGVEVEGDFREEVMKQMSASKAILE